MQSLGFKEISYLVPTGCIAELKFPIFCYRHGWDVAIPVFNNAPYDALIRGYKNNQWQSVQIKQAYLYHNRLRVDLRKKSQRRKVSYSPGDFDLLGVYNPVDNQWYIIPQQDIIHVKCEISINHNKWNKYIIHEPGTTKNS